MNKLRRLLSKDLGPEVGPCLWAFIVGVIVFGWPAIMPVMIANAAEGQSIPNPALARAVQIPPDVHILPNGGWIVHAPDVATLHLAIVALERQTKQSCISVASEVATKGESFGTYLVECRDTCPCQKQLAQSKAE